MKFHSTETPAAYVSYRDAIMHGVASDGGLFMPDLSRKLPVAFFNNLPDMSLQEIGYAVTDFLCDGEIPSYKLKEIATKALSFPIPVSKISDSIFSLEMYHGPTLAFKDVGARFLSYTLETILDSDSHVNVLVATTGDAGGAISSSFFNKPGIDVYVLYPSGKISRQQELQFASLGGNIHPVEVSGTFDDCQSIVRQSFFDSELKRYNLTSANSINPARLLPQIIPYFHGYAQIVRHMGRRPERFEISVPCGNLGNLCAGLIAKRIGLPVDRFIAVNNTNKVFVDFLESGYFTPQKSVKTIATAMDVGAPSNISRIVDMYRNGSRELNNDIKGVVVEDADIVKRMEYVYNHTQILLDPHAAAACDAIYKTKTPACVSMFLATAHPAKFKETVEGIIGHKIPIPSQLSFSPGSTKCSIRIAPTYSAFKKLFLSYQI